MLIYSILLGVFLISTQAFTINKITTNDVSTILNNLIDLDVNGGDTDDVVENFQNQASGKICINHDNAPQPLFKSVIDRITSGVTFKAFEALQALYTIPDITLADPNTAERTAAANAFLDEIINTNVMTTAIDFLTQAGLTTDAAAFKQQLFDLWFEPYARSTEKGSSGFETVFVGETSGENIIGFNNWYRFYLLEQTETVNYHGWFAPKDKQGAQMELQFDWDGRCIMRNGMLLGTSPEFEIAAYTICALANVGECTYAKKGQDVTLNVQTILDGTATRIDSVYPSSEGGTAPSSATVIDATVTSSNTKIQELIDAMYEVDEDKPVNMQIDYGKKVGSGTSTGPLIVSVDETLFEKEQYAVLISLYETANCTTDEMDTCIFKPDVCLEEQAVTGFKKAYLQNIYNVWTNTPMFQLAFKYLQDAGVATDWETFSPKLWTLWFGTYSRCGTTLGSSGFEHVFFGEWKSNTVDGHHNWVNYYRQQKAGLINYIGYYIYHAQISGTFEYYWADHIKKKGGFNLGTSPAFDFSMLSACVLTHSGAEKCKFNIAGYPMAVTSYTQACTDGTCISTAYPVVESS